MLTCSVTCWRSWRARCHTSPCVLPVVGTPSQAVQRMRRMARSSTPTVRAQRPVARPVQARSYRFSTASRRYRSRPRPRPTTILAIPASPMPRRRCSGSAGGCPYALGSRGGGSAVPRTLTVVYTCRRSLMQISKSLRAISIAVCGFAAVVLPVVAAQQPMKIEFSNDTVGAEPKSFVSVVGIWRIENEGGNKVLAVDGRQWKEGQASAGIADKARALYGERYAEFLDRVQAYAYYPYIVAQDVQDFRNGDITVRFEGISGRIDQGAGILFNLKPNGDYLTVRANCLENNLVLWKFEKGKRSLVMWIRDTPTPSQQWHELKVHIAGAKVEGYLDGKRYLEHTLPEPVSGRIGLWSKADSHVYFDAFTVTPTE